MPHAAVTEEVALCCGAVELCSSESRGVSLKCCAHVGAVAGLEGLEGRAAHGAHHVRVLVGGCRLGGLRLWPHPGDALRAQAGLLRWNDVFTADWKPELCTVVMEQSDILQSCLSMPELWHAPEMQCTHGGWRGPALSPWVARRTSVTRRACTLWICKLV